MTIAERLGTALEDRYRIERKLGAGGMVYLAEDLKHKRKVALKVLKPELAAVLGAERMAHRASGDRDGAPEGSREAMSEGPGRRSAAPGFDRKVDSATKPGSRRVFPP